MTSKRKKLIIERDRVNKKKAEELALSKSKAEFNRKFVDPKFARTKRKPGTKAVRLDENSSAKLNSERVQPFLHPKTSTTVKVRINKPLEDPVMMLREERAKAKYKLMQTRIAPAYNKGPEIYVSDGMIDDYVNGRTKRR